MCLVTFALDVHPTHRLVLAGNRDESTDRPASPLARWTGGSHLIAGRDLTAGGTWLGVTPARRWGVLTNVRDPLNPRTSVRSRGVLVTDFLAGSASAVDFAQQVFDSRADFDGFNLVIGDESHTAVVSTRSEQVMELGPGVYGLSNDRLDTPWPKLVRARTGLRASLDAAPVRLGDVLGLMDDTAVAPDERLPDTGVGLEWERRLSPIRIVSDGYGTRVSTALVIDHSGGGRVAEQTWNADGSRGALTEVDWSG